MTGATKFGDLIFGSISAETEFEDDPALLIDGFFDPFGIRSDVLDQTKWLVVGPKGAGKSSILLNLQHMASRSPQLFVKSLSLDDFPLDQIADIDTGTISPIFRAQEVWRYLLLIEIVSSIETDLGSPSNRERSYQTAYAKLREIGALPATTIQKSVMRLTKIDLKAKTPVLDLGTTFERSSDSSPFAAVTSHLDTIACSFTSDSKHFVFVDGLDSVIISENDAIRWTVLTALINAAHKLNKGFQEASSPLRVVVLCRSDIFYSLDNPNSERMIAHTATFDWLPENREPRDNYIIDLAELKASVHGSPRTPILSYLNNEIRFPDSREGKIYETADLLMRFTRYVPRDYLALLGYIAKQNGTSQRDVDDLAVRNGIKAYCSNYFVDEAWRGLLGILPAESARKAFNLLKTVRSRKFSKSELAAQIVNDDELVGIDLDRTLRHLHRLGLVSNYSRAEDGEVYLNYAYHSVYSRLDLDEDIVMHTALSTGLRRPRVI